jgi:hypothetical protein
LKAFYSNFSVLIILLSGLPLIGYNALIIPSLLIISRVVKNGYLIPTVLACSWIFFLYFLYYNAFAVVFALSVLPALIYLLKYLEIGSVRDRTNLLSLLSILLLVIVCIANYSYIYESIKYILTNASTNMLYWGNSGSRSDLVNANFWIVAFSVIFSIFLFNRKAFNKEKLLWLSYLLISPVLMVSYLVARADGDFPRAYKFSVFYLIVVLAFVLLYLKRKETIFCSNGAIR